MTDPVLLGIPQTFHSVEDVLEYAKKMNLPNVLVLAEKDDGELVFLAAPDITLADANWLLDRLKTLILLPNGAG